MRHSRRFTHAPESVPSARRFARGVLETVADELRDTIALMVSELASNCIRHTNNGFELTIIRTDAEIRVEATDRGAGEPSLRAPGLTDPHGRGLQIVDMFSADWGIERVPGDGKTVWFTVPLAHSAAA